MHKIPHIYSRDNRITPRLAVKADLRVRIWKSDTPELHAESLNLSERGIFFVTDRIFQRGEAVEVFLQMPEEVTGEPPTEWRCTGLVVHVQSVDGAKTAALKRWERCGATGSSCCSWTTAWLFRTDWS